MISLIWFKKYFKYVYIENTFYIIIMAFNRRIRGLNTPYLGATCRCTGKMIVTNKSNRGTHFFCLRCLTNWIKPLTGYYYKGKDYKNTKTLPQKYV
jgi:hypothetical protein